MLIEGRLTRWNGDKGFGFITPLTGSQEVFAHIKAFPSRGGRPQIGEIYTFEIELDKRGRKRATKVMPVRAARPVRRGYPAAQWGGASLFAVPAFVLLLVVVSAIWSVSGYFALVYLSASVLAFMAYWIDKASANAGRRRTPESTLHLLSLAGGWPGALLAQQFLRHKSVKTEFRAVFWGTVVANVVGFLMLVSPLGASLLRMS